MTRYERMMMRVGAMRLGGASKRAMGRTDAIEIGSYRSYHRHRGEPLDLTGHERGAGGIVGEQPSVRAKKRGADLGTGGQDVVREGWRI